MINMRKEIKTAASAIISVMVVVIVLVSFLHISGVMDIFGAGDYGTGRTINTKSQNAQISGTGGSISLDNPYIKVENALNHNDMGEVLDSSRYIVSWQPNEYSVRITARVDALMKTRYDQLWSLLYGFGQYSVVFIRNNYWWDVTYTDLSGRTTKIIDGKNFTGGPGDPSVRTDYVHVVQGYPRRSFPTAAIVQEEMPSQTQESGWWAPPNTQYPTETVRLETEVFVFEMKGNRVGSINIRCYLQDSAYAYSDTGLFPMQVRNYQKTGSVLLSEDNAYLPSGRGEVRVESVGAIRTDGTDTTDETGVVYTKYVFEEGAQVMFSVDTGYSGVNLEPDQAGYRDGWYLQVVNSRGQTVQNYPVGDGLKNYKITYAIPAGSFIPGDPNDNEWMVVLSNTLFDQSESRIFVIDSYAKMPGKTTLTVSSNQVDQFSSISWTATAAANPSGTNDIHHFRVWATYTSETSTDYALTAKNYPAISVGGGKYRASGSFQVAKGDKNVYITAVAVDSEPRAGVEGQQIVYVKQVIPTPPGGGGPDGDGIVSDWMQNIWLYLLAGIAAVVAVFGVLYYFKRRKKSQ